MDRTAALDGASKLFKLGGQDLQFGGERLGIDHADLFGGIEQGFEHHGDAWQDSFLNPVERLFKARLLLSYGHGAAIWRQQLSVREMRRGFWEVSGRQ